MTGGGEQGDALNTWRPMSEPEEGWLHRMAEWQGEKLHGHWYRPVDGELTAKLSFLVELPK